MATEQTAEEVKADFVGSFPNGIGELAYELWRSVAHVHLNWMHYRSLYGTSPERIELLNWAAETFFGLLDGILRHDVVLAIARLTDPPQSAGHDNASLARLIDSLGPRAEPGLVAAWREKLKALQEYCEPLRTLRNRFLAHEDLATALHYHPEPLPGISRAYVEGALERIRDVLGSIEETFRGFRTSHELIISNRDGEALIWALESAREHSQCRKEEFRRKYGFATGDE